MKEKERNDYIDLLEDLLGFYQDKIDLIARAEKSEGSKKELYQKNIVELDEVILEKKEKVEKLMRIRRAGSHNKKG